MGADALTNETPVLRVADAGAAITLALSLAEAPLDVDAPGAVLVGTAQEQGAGRWQV